MFKKCKCPQWGGTKNFKRKMSKTCLGMGEGVTWGCSKNVNVPKGEVPTILKEKCQK